MCLPSKVLLAISLIAVPALARAEGDLALKPEKLPDMVKTLTEKVEGRPI